MWGTHFRVEGRRRITLGGTAVARLPPVRGLSIFFAPAGYRVVKIMCSRSEVVLRTMKNYKEHYSLFLFKPLLQGNSSTSNVFVFDKRNSVTKGVS
jgi:hypothetical protein